MLGPAAGASVSRVAGVPFVEARGVVLVKVFGSNKVLVGVDVKVLGR